jgi:hypothetical protein
LVASEVVSGPGVSRMGSREGRLMERSETGCRRVQVPAAVRGQPGIRVTRTPSTRARTTPTLPAATTISVAV